MTDLVITAASVVAGANAQKEAGIAGATIAAGEMVYKAATGKYLLGDGDDAATAVRTARGMALNSAGLDQPLDIARGGDVTVGAVLIAGTAYYLSDTPGKICPLADVAAGDDVILVGLAKSTTVLAIDIQDPGVTI